MGRRRPRLLDAAPRELVERRAGGRCEYCRAPQDVCGYRFHLEHIVPSSLGGVDAPSNRALACASCNLAKADRVSGIDPTTGAEVRFFDPRVQRWSRHFRWADDGEYLIGLTRAGRATIAALDMNSATRWEARRLWFQTGWLP